MFLASSFKSPNKFLFLKKMEFLGGGGVAASNYIHVSFQGSPPLVIQHGLVNSI